MANGYARYSAFGSSGGGGSGVTSLNGLTGAVTLVPGTGISITPSGNTLIIAATGSGSGTVTSVALADGSTTPIYGISGSPVTTAGALTFTLATQAANTIFAGPTTGADAQPTFRALVPADVPGSTGAPNRFADYDAAGNLESSPTWGLDSTGQAVATNGGTQPTTSFTSLQLNSTFSSPFSGGYEGVIVSATLSSTMTFQSSYNVENTYNSGFNNSGEIAQYQDQSAFNSGALSNGYISFSAIPTIAGTVGYTGVAINPTLTNATTGFSLIGVGASINSGFTNSQGITAFSDFNRLNTGASTVDYTSFVSGPTLSGTVSGNYVGVNVSPQGSVAGSGTGLQINMSGITDSSPEGVIGIESDSRLDFNVTNTMTSGLSFQIGNRLEDLMHVPSGSPVTGTDTLGNNIAGDLSAQDNIADGPTGGIVGWTGTGFISSLAVAAGKTVATANVFAPLAALPDPGYTTGGTITKLSMIKTAAPLPEGGTLAITNLYGFRLDNSVPFRASATNAWGLYIEDATLPNFIEGSLGIGSNAPTARLMLPASTTSAGSAPLKIVAGSLMTTPENGAIETDGTDIFWTDNIGARQTLNNGANSLFFATSSLVSTSSSGIISTSPTLFSNSPAFTFTPLVTGTYSIRANVPVQSQVSALFAYCEILASSGSPTQLAGNIANVYSQLGAPVVDTVPLETVFTLNGGTPYTFDIYGWVDLGNTVLINGGNVSFNMTATRIGT